MTRRLVVAAVLLVIAGAATASGQSQIPADGRTDVSIEASTSAMVRSTGASTAAGQALNRAADGGLDAMIGAHRLGEQPEAMASGSDRRHLEGSTHRTGMWVERGTARELMLAGRSWEASVRCGYKTDGYLLDAPYRATALASVALTARF